MRNIFKQGVIFCGAILFSWSNAFGQGMEELSIPHMEGVVEETDIRFPASPEEDGAARSGPAVWTHSFLQPGSDAMQVHFNNIEFDPDEFFEIDIVNGNGSVVMTINKETLRGRTSMWSDSSEGQSLGIALFGNRNNSLKFTIDAVSYDRSGPVMESIIGVDSREHLFRYEGDLLPTVDRVSGAVAKLSFMATSPSGRQGRYVCTGFLIDDDTLVTNEHCVADAETCATTKIIFGYSYDRLGQMPGKEQFDCQSVDFVNEEFDMAILKIFGSPGRKWGHVQIASRDVVDNERLFVLQHPAGEPKQISEVECSVFRAQAPGRGDDSDFAHTCDTLGGSSGSPVFNVLGEVVGLHHWGRAPSGTYRNANRAVRIGKVSDFLQVHSNSHEDNATVSAPEEGTNDEKTE